MPGADGAVYRPLLLIVPPVAVQVTPVLAVPETVAVNCCVAPVDRAAMPGETPMATEGVVDTVTMAEADLVGSATLVAVTE